MIKSCDYYQKETNGVSIPKPPVIKVTTDYSIFKIIDKNREIVPRHLKRLKEAIGARNFLRLFPIIVNSEGHIIEGQHRYISAKELKLPLYYIVDDEIQPSDIAMINNNRKSWTARDYIDFYAKSGNEHYKHMRKLSQQHPKLTITTLMRLVDKSRGDYWSGGGDTHTMRNGKWEAPNHKVAFAIAELCERMLKQYDYIYTPQIVLSIKNAVMQSGLHYRAACERIFEKRHFLPNKIERGETCLFVFKNILQVN